MKIMSFVFFRKALLVFFLAALFAVPSFVQERIELVKSSRSDTVYFLDTSGVRHPFPSRAVYESWYGDDFSRVVTVRDSFLSTFPLGENIRMRPGTLVKIPSSPDVYAVEPYGVLRRIASEEVAQEMFGEMWQDRVRDIPEAFWENYTVGKPIKYIHEIPDGFLYQIEGEDQLYYVWRGALVPVSGVQAFQENRLAEDERIVGTRVLYVRSRPITGLERFVFDPAQELVSAAPDCRSDRLRAGMVFITAEKGIRPAYRSFLEQLQTVFPDVWNAATDSLSNISFENQIDVQYRDKYTWVSSQKGRVIDVREVAASYFTRYPDTVDFLIVLNDFYTFPDRHAEFTAVTNDIRGTHKATIRRGMMYGSNGKLKGVANMGNIRTFIDGQTGDVVVFSNLLLHELGHYWTGSAVFLDAEGNVRTDLLRSDDKMHWSRYTDFISPLGGWGWVPQEGGVYKSRAAVVSQNSVKAFAPIDLYFMGLYPKSVIGPVFYLVPEEEDKVNNTIRARRAQISVDDIIRAQGSRVCLLESQ